jgi:hypothetical protein
MSKPYGWSERGQHPAGAPGVMQAKGVESRLAPPVYRPAQAVMKRPLVGVPMPVPSAMPRTVAPSFAPVRRVITAAPPRPSTLLAQPSNPAQRFAPAMPDFAGAAVRSNVPVVQACPPASAVLFPGVVQCGKRKIIGPGLNYVVLPTQTTQTTPNKKLKTGPDIVEQSSAYSEHVMLRVKICLHFVLQVLHYAKWAKDAKRNPAFKMTGVFAPNAEQQVAVGNNKLHLGTNVVKSDASHLVNTSIRAAAMKKGMSSILGQKHIEEIQDLEVESGATTLQLKVDNVGPDKVIDSCMTEFTNEYSRLEDENKPTPSATELLQKLTDLCLGRLTKHAKAANPNYKEAIEGVKNAKNLSPFDIELDVVCWKNKNFA